MESRDVVIIGAGPTGLGAATRLHQLRHDDWVLLDKADEAGGLACTDVTPEGFLFDMGGHVIFSHYDYFDQLLDAAVGTGDEHWSVHQRVSYVWIKKRWVPYPFQNNICGLPLEDQINCINGLIEAKVANTIANTPPVNFDEWIMRVMGKGIADIFMRPYNFKVWAIPTNLMQCSWLGERVATANVAKVIENVLRNKEESGWGPNAVFRFPKEGGTGGIWKKVAALLPQEKLRFQSSGHVTGIDAENKILTTADGHKIKYNKLISTLPLDLLLKWLHRDTLASQLTYSSSHIIGIGLRGVNPHDIKCWLYYPEDDCPFYRCTIFSHYAEKNVPSQDALLPTLRYGSGDVCSDGTAKPGPYWSIMLEVSESPYKPVNVDTILDETIRGALNTHLIQSSDEIVSLYHRRLEHGYPTPCLKRDGVLQEALPMLKKEYNIWSRGRFGSYKYEVGNQDHSCMLGVEAADNILYGAKEFTLFHPSLTNEGGAKNKDMVYERRMN